MINLKDSNNQPPTDPKMQDQYLSFADAVQYLGSGTHNRISKLADTVVGARTQILYGIGKA